MSATNHDDTAGIPFPPPLAFISGLAVGAGLHHFIPAPILQAARGVNALKVVGAALLIFGVTLAVFALVSFRMAKTSPLPERPSTSLVVGGPFRVSRNPLYVSMSLIYAGISLCANALWPLLLLVPVVAAIRHFVIAREERYLLQRFGSEYEDYCRQVRRWL